MTQLPYNVSLLLIEVLRIYLHIVTILLRVQQAVTLLLSNVTLTFFTVTSDCRITLG